MNFYIEKSLKVIFVLVGLFAVFHSTVVTADVSYPDHTRLLQLIIAALFFYLAYRIGK